MLPSRYLPFAWLPEGRRPQHLLDVNNNTVFLEFGGGCQGCGMVSVTLKYGVERAIRDEVPEVGDILDTTDHASGRNPYYAPSTK